MTNTGPAARSITHLRLAEAGQGDPSEAQILARMLDAFDWALAQPGLTIGWRVSFQTCRKHLADSTDSIDSTDSTGAALRRESPRQKQRPALQ